MKQRIFKVISLVIIAIAVLLGYYFLNYHFGFSIPCLVYHFTGYYCPTCGVTRMLFSLLSLNFVAAFNYNQLLFIISPFILFFIAYFIYIYIFEKKDFILNKIPIWVWILILLIFIAFGILRNFSWFYYWRP